MQKYVVVFNFLGDIESDALNKHPELLKHLESIAASPLNNGSVFFFRSESKADDLLKEMVPLVEEGEEIFLFEVSDTNWNCLAGQDAIDIISLGIQPTKAEDEDDFPELINDIS